MEASKSVFNGYCDHMLWKDFLEFKNIILEEKLSIKFKNGHIKPLRLKPLRMNPFQNYGFKLQEDFSEDGIRVFLEKGLWSFQILLILQIWDKSDVPKTFQKQFWKLDSKPKKPRFHVSTKPWFRKIPCGLFSKPLKEGIFSVSGIFIENYLRNLTCWEKSKNRFGLSEPKLSKNFFNTQTFVHYLLDSVIRALEKA
jgi:hypothetical protein